MQEVPGASDRGSVGETAAHLECPRECTAREDKAAADDPPTGSSPGFNRRFVSGASWTAVSQVASQAVTFLAGVLLARLLTPTDFGLVGLAFVYTSLIALLGQVGFGAAVVYRQDLAGIDLSTTYWAGLTINAVLCAAAVALSPAAASFFHNDRLGPVVAVSSLALILASLGGVQRSLLEKRMRFKRLASNELAASGAYAAVATVMALRGFGVWSLVVGRLVQSGTDSVLAWLGSRWTPRIEFSRSSFRSLFGYGSRVWGSNLLYYGQENVDNLIVGRVLGATSLGFYSFAFRLANVPRWFLMTVVGRVMFPSFSSAQDDDDLLRRAYLSISGFVTLVAMSLCVGLSLVAPEFIEVVYGAKWIPAVAPLQILAVAAAIYSVGQLTAPALMSRGRPGIQLRIGLISTVVLLVSALIGVRWGTLGVSVAVLGAVTVGCVIGQAAVFRELRVGARVYADAVGPPLLATATMAVGLWAWRGVGRSVLGVAPLVWMILAIILGASLFIVTLALIRAPQIGDARRYIRAVRSGVPAESA